MMQVVFIVVSRNDNWFANMKVFNHRRHAEKYQFELKEHPEYKDATIYEKEVIE